MGISYFIEAITDTRPPGRVDRPSNQVPEAAINAAFAEMPATFVPSQQEATLMRDYLLDRRTRLGTVFQTHRAMFPNLDEGQL